MKMGSYGPWRIQKLPMSWMRRQENRLRPNIHSASRVLIPCLLASGLYLLVACSGSPSSPSPIPSTTTPASRQPPAETTTERTTASPRPSSTPTSIPTRTPTPTPPPLPEVCLRQQFADDIQVCQPASRYDIELTIDPASAQVTGRQQITYTNRERDPLDALYLRLFPSTRAYGGAMTVTHLLKDSRPITPSVESEGSALRVPLDPPLKSGRTLTLAMDFTVDVPTSGAYGHGLFSYVQGVMALPTVYPLIPVHDEDGWNIEIAPVHGDDIFADVSIYKVRIAAPPEFTLISSGACSHPQEGTWLCEAGPMRDFALILGGDYERAAREVAGVVVNSYFYRRHGAGGGKALDVAVRALETFSGLFGPYPYTELDVVETPNRLGGMEYSSLVVIEDRLYPGVVGVEWLTAHEVAHQWWTVVVGNDQVDEPWLDEALTQYSTLLYYEEAYGKERADGILYSEFIQTYESLKGTGRDMPAGLPADSYPPDLYWAVVYDKGALYFHALRERVGDDSFFEILQAYYERHRYQIATPAAFLETVEDVTGGRHQDLYDKWIGGDPDE